MWYATAGTFMKLRRRVAIATPLALWIPALMCGGCVIPPRIPAMETPRRVGGAAAGQPVTSAELDELTRAFADRYVGLLYSVCDELKRDNPDPVQRREAQVLLLDCSTNVYDIASNADAFTRALDLVVVTTLVSQVWVDDGRAAEVFGERGKALALAMLHAKEESRALAARVLTAEQLQVLDSLQQDWRKENPEMVGASFVRFSNFAIGRGMSAVSEVLAARGQFAEIGQAGQAVDEARLLGERMFYRLKREPTLLRWQAAAMKDELVSTPEVAMALADMHRLTDQVEQLPANVAAERQVTLAAIDDRLQRADATAANIKAALAEANTFIAALGPTSESLQETFKTAGTVFARYEAWDRWNVTQGRPFDIREHTEAARELATTAQKINDLLSTSGQLLASPQWGGRMQEVNESADGRIKMMAAQSRLVLNGFFWRVYIVLGALFVILMLHRLIPPLLMRRFRTPRNETHTVIPAARANGRANFIHSSKAT